MKILITLLTVLFALSTNLNAQNYSFSSSNSTYVNGYYKSNGTYVNGHYKTKSNAKTTDNYSTKGNVNSYTGQNGYKPNNYSNGASNYGQGKTIKTGPRGGQYYINSKGNKTYVPKR